MLSYRPDADLERLRTYLHVASRRHDSRDPEPSASPPRDGEMEECCSSLINNAPSTQPWWLRTLILHPNRLALPLLCSDVVHVEHVVLDASLVHKKQFAASLGLLRGAHRLTSIDLRNCLKTLVTDSLLSSVALAHSQSLRKLCLPQDSRIITQQTLDRFTSLEELHICGCQNFTNVDFCGATLRVLYANNCGGLTSSGLRNATRLEVLHVASCEWFKEIPSCCSHCLLELNCGRDCGINSSALAQFHRLQVFRFEYNDKITTLEPFASRLRELDARVYTSTFLDDLAFAAATGLVRLELLRCCGLTTFAPFASSLRVLSLSSCLMTDACLESVNHLVCFTVCNMSSISCVQPFASSLLELTIQFECGIDDAALVPASNLFSLVLLENTRLTTIQPFATSLRHFVAKGSHITNDELQNAPNLHRLHNL